MLYSMLRFRHLTMRKCFRQFNKRRQDSDVAADVKLYIIKRSPIPINRHRRAFDFVEFCRHFNIAFLIFIRYDTIYL